ncbi:fibrous sheath CABYR-binding protein [Anopheles nili]|uniref:fibrous sheath CABYR-binding protein n=1 Tax=Anopheles nili TaxID=185578 RepID=UPI00237B252F|nr:fibrous sheath CABYR-binding protein [Anopheles nili]
MVRIVPLAAVLLTLAVLANARILPNRSKQVKVYSYVLPAGAEEIRDDINHSFACANRTDGFYVDIDNDCQIFHRCQDNARFSFICAERTVFSQMYQTCVHDGQLGYPCEDSAQYYPDGEGYEPSAAETGPAEEASQPEEMLPERQAAPSQELEAPQTPTKMDDAVVQTADDTPVENVQSIAEPSQPAVAVEDMQNDLELQEDHHHNHQDQVNADLFDSVEEESDKSSENSAQEVMDEEEPSATADAAGSESSNAVTQQQEESNEMEITEDQDQPATAAPTSASDHVISDATAQVEIVNEQSPDEMPSQSTPADETNGDREAQYEGDSLLNAVQMVEELEPIVHDLAVAGEELQPLVAEMVQDPAPVNLDVASHEDNEVLPESSAGTSDMEVAPSSASSSSEGDESSSGEEESDQQVNELAPESEVNAASLVPTADESSSETIVSGDSEADEALHQHTSEPETADVKPEDTEADLSVDEPASTSTGEQRPLESPAIVEEMTALRPNDSAELPELIVSTEFHLDVATQGPAIRRRKTFLFRADAIGKRP